MPQPTAPYSAEPEPWARGGLSCRSAPPADAAPAMTARSLAKGPNLCLVPLSGPAASPGDSRSPGLAASMSSAAFHSSAPGKQGGCGEPPRGTSPDSTGACLVHVVPRCANALVGVAFSGSYARLVSVPFRHWGISNACYSSIRYPYIHTYIHTQTYKCDYRMFTIRPVSIYVCRREGIHACV